MKLYNPINSAFNDRINNYTPPAATSLVTESEFGEPHTISLGDIKDWVENEGEEDANSKIFQAIKSGSMDEETFLSYLGITQGEVLSDLESSYNEDSEYDMN